MKYCHMRVRLEDLHPNFKKRQLSMRLGTHPERIFLLYKEIYSREEGLEVIQKPEEYLNDGFPGVTFYQG
ncbi:hypothetical protein SAMN05660649_00711 [Desulfotomaculum arcticum]|uniref:Uncharacterized protein n=1 Tax=Desulfotruncus arcticus DSM 17038 TaxID=1121424 RepID=A0A1I2P498_9FIRM|nr:hypothetical protein [Desulfotruncus arcticus]SFG11032.1 hypothetical protein SAMN05660649_00711 [Desulfotomaculum arcticum] [Desulfotruncus arcticus DSM 17038]